MTQARLVISVGAVGAAAVMLMAAAAVTSQRAEATAAYSQQTGQACGACHVKKEGGGALTKRGKDFQAKKKK